MWPATNAWPAITTTMVVGWGSRRQFEVVSRAQAQVDWGDEGQVQLEFLPDEPFDSPRRSRDQRNADGDGLVPTAVTVAQRPVVEAEATRAARPTPERS